MYLGFLNIVTFCVLVLKSICLILVSLSSCFSLKNILFLSKKILNSMFYFKKKLSRLFLNMEAIKQ